MKFEKCPFPRILRELRLKNNMTKKELALTSGVSEKTISKWESAESAPRAVQFMKLMEIFNVTADFLLGIDEHKQKKDT